MFGHYEKTVDRDSAYEKLKGRTEEKQQDAQARPVPGQPAPARDSNPLSDIVFGKTGPRGGQRDGLAQTLAKSVVRTMGSAVGREIVRGVLGSILGKRR